MITSG